MGLYFTVFYCNYKRLVQAGWLLDELFMHYSILMRIWCFISLALQEVLTKSSKLAVATGQNRPKGQGKILNHLRFKAVTLIYPLYILN